MAKKNLLSYDQAKVELAKADKALQAAGKGPDVKAHRDAAVTFADALRTARGAQRKELSDPSALLGK